MLCGEAGSIDIGDFLSEEIKGPASMTCKTGAKGSRDCKFEEPAMNDLISSIFGDSSITLNCASGECVHYQQVPGYQSPVPPPHSIFWVVISAIGAVVFVLLIAAMLWVLGRHAKHEEYGSVRLPEDETARLMADHVPAALSFKDLTYHINSKPVLSGITGTVNPGEIMAIVGSSGAGKTTCEYRQDGIRDDESSELTDHLPPPTQSSTCSLVARREVQSPARFWSMADRSPMPPSKGLLASLIRRTASCQR
jgi:hypothetical protein